MESPKTEEDAEVFAANVLTEPATEAGGSSKVSTSKQRKASGEEPRRKSKKSKVSTIVEGTEGVEGHEEAPVAEPGVRDFQTLEGFCNRTTVSVVAKSHLYHLRDHYSVHQKVLMRIPLKYGLRLTTSPFVDPLLSSIGREPGQLGPFA
ncbi:hypothetical protein LIER_17925 [Lithospermum erythrorhizon]|uniref:Uncharacterized protein n=1 Tax=Lithospermum erythrorhizon TaxID=34254 RepID=A0AAV3QD74_LITER